MALREGSEQSNDGIVPFNELLLKNNTFNCVNNPISLGIMEPVVAPSN
jgi:hypothetical protein